MVSLHGRPFVAGIPEGGIRDTGFPLTLGSMMTLAQGDTQTDT